MKDAASQRVKQTLDFLFLDQRPVSLTIYFFTPAPMQGDVDNIVKPIMDALEGVAYLLDRAVERVVVQKFEPDAAWSFAAPSGQLAAALAHGPPSVYVRVDDDLTWRRQ